MRGSIGFAATAGFSWRVIDPSESFAECIPGRIFRPYRLQASVLPTAASSVDWYRGWRDHLEFAEIMA